MNGWHKQSRQVIYALEVEQANEDKIALAVSEDYMLQFLAMYESPEMFADRLSDLLQHPLIQRGSPMNHFKKKSCSKPSNC